MDGCCMRLSKSKIEILPAINVKRVAPKNLRPGDEKFFNHEYARSFPPIYLYTLKNIIVSPEGIAFKKLNIFEPSLLDISRKKIYNWKYLLGIIVKRKRNTLNKNDIYILAFDEWSGGYFHWMCDVLPRILAIDNQLHNCILLLPQRFSSTFIIETLKIFNLKGIQRIPNKSIVNIKTLLLPTHIAPTGNYNPAIMFNLRDRLINYYNRKDISFGDKIYISRKKAEYRYIINESEVENVIKKYGFKTIYFEDYTIMEQISIMRNTKYFVGIIGANLTNMMFMKEGGKVFLFNKNNNAADNCYFNLANVYNLHYYYQFCSYEDTRPGAYWNLYVDIDLFKNNLEKMLLD